MIGPSQLGGSTRRGTIQPGRLAAVKKALLDTGIDGLTVWELRGHGRQKGHTATYRGHEYSVDLRSKIKIEIVLDVASPHGRFT